MVSQVGKCCIIAYGKKKMLGVLSIILSCVFTVTAYGFINETQNIFEIVFFIQMFHAKIKSSCKFIIFSKKNCTC